VSTLEVNGRDFDWFSLQVPTNARRSVVAGAAGCALMTPHVATIAAPIANKEVIDFVIAYVSSLLAAGRSARDRDLVSPARVVGQTAKYARRDHCFNGGRDAHWPTCASRSAPRVVDPGAGLRG
jgi:hypothetical protein